MHSSLPRQARPLRTSVAVLLACAPLGAASCATPQDVQYTREVAKDYESQVFDLERKLEEMRLRYDELSAKYQREQRAGMQGGRSSVDASFKSRLDDLASMIDGMDRPLENVEKFEVEGGYIYMIQDRILFDSGSADLGQEGETALAQLASEIAAAPHGKIFVRGHTDNDPVRKPATRARFPHGNLQLSAERAVSVASYLIGQTEVGAHDVVVMGFGSWKPVRPNDSADSKRMNRRVEIFVSDPES